MRGAPRPFFEHPGGPRPSRERLLLISYHFPPAQTAGALRWEKLSDYAAERGWAMDVVTLAPASLRTPDRSRLAALSSDIRIYGVPEPTLWRERAEHTAWRVYRRVKPVRKAADSAAPAAAAASTPGPLSLGRSEIRWSPGDLRRGLRRAYYAELEYARHGHWARAAADLSLGLAASQAYAAVISCGPPHMAHAAGRRVAQARRLPLVIDLRDPWSLVQRLPEEIASPRWLTLAGRHERLAVARAALIVANTEPLCLALQAKYPQARGRVITATNGYDEDPLPESRPDRRFTIAYAGAIYLDRDPRVLFKAAARVVRELELRPSDLRIELMGDVASFDGVPTPVIARGEGLEGFVGVRPPGPRREAMEFLADAAVLLSLPQDSDMAIPSKIFEYMRFDAWLLALAEPESATARLLRGSSADVVAPHDLDGLTAVLRKRYLEFSRGQRPTKLATDPRYSRRDQARRLFDAVEVCIRHGDVGHDGAQLSSAPSR